MKQATNESQWYTCIVSIYNVRSWHIIFRGRKSYLMCFKRQHFMSDTHISCHYRTQPCVPMTLTPPMIKVKTASNSSSARSLVNILDYYDRHKMSICRCFFPSFLLFVSSPQKNIKPLSSNTVVHARGFFFFSQCAIVDEELQCYCYVMFLCRKIAHHRFNESAKNIHDTPGKDTFSFST